MGERLRRLHALARAHAGVAVLAMLFLWPPIHMGLARQYHFSTWRYGGFGMYAAPDAGDREVHILVSSCPAIEAAGEPTSTSHDRHLGFYHRIGVRGVTPLFLPRLDEAEKLALAAVVKNIRSLARPADFERLADWVDARLFEGRPPALIGVFLSDPHLDRHATLAYSDLWGFVREGGQWTTLGTLRARAAVEAMQRRAEACP